MQIIYDAKLKAFVCVNNQGLVLGVAFSERRDAETFQKFTERCRALNTEFNSNPEGTTHE